MSDEAENDAAVPAHDATESDADGWPEIPVVTFRGNAFKEVLAVPTTTMTLIMGVGKLRDGDAPVLVAFMDTAMVGAGRGDDVEVEQVFSHMVTFENAAFIVASFTRDLRTACEHLADLSQGPLRPEPARLRQAQVFLQSAMEDALDGIEQLEMAIQRES